MNRHIAIICAGFLFLLCLGIVGSMDAQDAQAAQDEYCGNVGMWLEDESKGIPPEHRRGWPDFNNNYDRVCPAGDGE